MKWPATIRTSLDNLHTHDESARDWYKSLFEMLRLWNDLQKIRTFLDILHTGDESAHEWYTSLFEMLNFEKDM